MTGARLRPLTPVAAFATTCVLLSACTADPPSDPEPEASQAGASPTTAARYVPDGWPSRRDTGASGPLRKITGFTITDDGTVLEDVLVTGTLTILADDVTLRNIKVLQDSYYGILIYGKNIRIEDSTVKGVNRHTMAGIAAIEGGTFVATRIEVRKVEDGVRLADDCVLKHSLIHELVGDEEAHYDAVTADGGFRGWRVVHNTILNPHRQTGAVWVGDERYGDSAGVLRNNYIAGGGYSIYAGPGAGQGIRVVDNVFSTRYYRRSGYWGVSTRWDPEGNIWSGNRWIDGPRAGQQVRP